MMLFFIVLLLLLPHAADGAEICCLNCHICHKHTIFLFPAQGIIAPCPARKNLMGCSKNFFGRLKEFLWTAQQKSTFSFKSFAVSKKYPIFAHVNIGI